MTETKHLPAWRYQYGQPPKVVLTQAELEAAAAEGWVDHPVDFAPVPEATEAAPAADIPPRLTDELIEQSAREGPFAAPAPEAIDWRARELTDPEPGAPVPIPIPASEVPKPKRKR